MKNANYNKLSNFEFELIYSKIPRLCTELLIRTENGILFTKRSIYPGAGFWHLPGRTIVMGFNVEDNVKLTAKIELGVDIEKIKFLFVGDLFNSPHVNGQVVSLFYEVQIKKGQIISLNNESSEYKYFKKLPKNSLGFYKKLLNSYFTK